MVLPLPFWLMFPGRKELDVHFLLALGSQLPGRYKCLCGKFANLICLCLMMSVWRCSITDLSIGRAIVRAISRNSRRYLQMIHRLHCCWESFYRLSLPDVWDFASSIRVWFSACWMRSRWVKSVLHRYQGTSVRTFDFFCYRSSFSAFHSYAFFSSKREPFWRWVGKVVCCTRSCTVACLFELQGNARSGSCSLVGPR